MDPSRVDELLFSFPASAATAGPAKGDSRVSPVDPDILSYLASFELDDEEDEGEGADHEQAVQDVDEICASASKAFAALPSAERTRRVVDFLSALGGASSSSKAKADDAAADPADAAASAAAAALAAALKDLSSSGGKGGGSGISDKDAPRSSVDADGAAADGAAADDGQGEREDAAAVDALADLIPTDRADARRFAAHVLRERCSGDADVAGEYLLSLGDGDGGLAAAVDVWLRMVRAREEAAAREASARERDRQATLERFAWRPESTSGGGGGNGGGGGGGGAGKPPPEAKNKRDGAGDKGSAPRVRYLEGAAVTTKGEKYVVVSQKEEWDGGSRGKVKTKGKRGVGFA